MRPDQERVRNLLTDTVTLLCKNGLQYQKELRVQGLLGITLDDSDVFVVHINETFGDLIGGAINIHAGDGDDDKLAMADIGGGDIEQHGEPLTTATASKLKHQRKSGDSFGSPVPSPGGQQIQQRPIKRLMTSTPNSSRSDKRAMKSSRSSDNEDIPVATSTPQPDVAVRIKTEKDVVIIDDKSNVQSCDRVGYPEATGSEVHGQYGHFNESLAYSDPSGDPGGGGGSGVETAPRQQDYYSDNNRSATNFNMTDPGFGGPFVADMRQYGGHDATHDATSSTHDTVYTADGQAMVNSVAGCSAWDPSRTAAASRQAFSGTEDGAETISGRRIARWMPKSATQVASAAYAPEMSELGMRQRNTECVRNYSARTLQQWHRQHGERAHQGPVSMRKKAALCDQKKEIARMQARERMRRYRQRKKAYQCKLNEEKRGTQGNV